RFGGDGLGVQVGVGDERAGGGQRVGAARADADQAVVRLDDVARSRHDERVLAIGHRQERLQPPQDTVGAPILGQLHRRPRQVTPMLLELRLEAGEEGERIGGGPGEARHHTVLVELADFPCAGLDDGRADRDLAVAGDRHLTPVTDRDDRSGREAPRRRVRSHFARARGWAASYARMSWSVPTCAYRCVVDSRLWPRSSWIIRRSAPASSRCVANVWRSVWGLTRRVIPHACALPPPCAPRPTIEWIERPVSRPPRRLAKSAPRASPRVARWAASALAARPPYGTMRSLRPLPSTRTVCRARSTSSRSRPASSETRSPLA